MFLYINTLKYLKGSQFYHRSFFMFKKKLLFKTNVWINKNHIKNVSYLNSIENVNPFKFNSISNLNIEYSDLEQHRNQLFNKEFTFLNKKVKFKEKLGWHDPQLSQLWRYNLHYFDYLRFLIEIEKSEPSIQNYNLLKYYVENWIMHNKKVGLGDGWHSYTISLRVVNWIFAYSAFCEYIEEDEEFKNKFLGSIVAQSSFLMENLEYDVVGNHLFENLKTIIISGIFFNENPLGKKLKETGEIEMSKQLSEQFLEDGGHFELSAMYHSILLKGLTELIYVYDNLEFEVPKDFLDTQKRALDFLANVTHPDGEIPLFNDAAFNIANSPNYIKEYTSLNIENKQQLSLFDQLVKRTLRTDSKATIELDVYMAKDSGYLRVKDEKMFSIIDFGKPCPDYLPAHAHADIFSYELSYKGSRLIVDTGTYEYFGPNRDNDRATKSHNTLTINRENQSEVWGSFRVAQRGFPTVHSYQKNKDFIELFSSHDGYFKKFKAIHYRKFIHVFNEAIIILDYVESKELVESFIHLHPDCNITAYEDNSLLINNEIVLRPINANFTIEESVYHPEFGIEENNKKVVVHPVIPGVFGYYYSYGNHEIVFSGEKISITNGIETLDLDTRMEIL